MHKTLTLNVQNMDVRHLLKMIAELSGQNMLIDEDVQGVLTLQLKQVPWQEALEAVLHLKGLTQYNKGNIIKITHKEVSVDEDDYEPIGKARGKRGNKQLEHQIFQLNYIKVDDVKKMLMGDHSLTLEPVFAADQHLLSMLPSPNRAVVGNELNQISKNHLRMPTATTRWLSAHGSLVVDGRTNQLFVYETSERLKALGDFLQRIDQPVRQVMIEARIIEADSSFGRTLGVRWNAGQNTTSNNNGAQGLQNITVNFPAGTVAGFAPVSGAWGVFSSSASQVLQLELSALEAEGRGQIVSNPRLITADKVRAVIEQGTELPYQTATLSGSNGLQFRKANLKLDVLPQITPNGQVILDVDLNKDSVGQQTATGFAIDTKHVRSQVWVESGGTVVMGGISQDTHRKQHAKIPGLGSIPLLGRLFSNSRKAIDQTELWVFLTPHILQERPKAQAPVSWPEPQRGTELKSTIQ